LMSRKGRSSDMVGNQWRIGTGRFRPRLLDAGGNSQVDRRRPNFWTQFGARTATGEIEHGPGLWRGSVASIFICGAKCGCAVVIRRSVACLDPFFFIINPGRHRHRHLAPRAPPANRPYLSICASHPPTVAPLFRLQQILVYSSQIPWPLPVPIKPAGLAARGLRSSSSSY
jgi:hypothetical protein